MKRQKKVKELSLPMEFNPGLERFEPELPLRRKGEQTRRNISWGLILTFFGTVLILGLILFFVF